jgi:pimeloyl-ACP methyl ester carboxylesterase
MEQTRRSVVTPDGTVLSVHVHCDRHAPDDAPTLVLAHGWTLTHESWAPVVDALAESGLRVVLWDQRGHGRSAIGFRRKQIDDLTVDHLGRDLRSVVRSVVPQTSPVVLGGHSLGGLTVMSYAAQFPDEVAARVRGVLLVATASHGIELGSRRGEARFMRLLAKGLPLPAGPAARYKAHRASLFGDSPDAEHVTAVRRQVASTRTTTFGAFHGPIARVDVRGAFAALGALPVSIVVGRRDRLTPTERSRALWLALPHATWTEVPTAGHMLPYEATEVLASEAVRLTTDAGHARGAESAESAESAVH